MTDILDGWAPVSGHWVRGFQSNVGSDHGDSGGAVFQGNKAVGVIRGGIPSGERVHRDLHLLDWHRQPGCPR